jgi:hypothetical protein
MQNTRKPYVAPTLTAHGTAVEKTLGQRGKVAEFINYWFPPLP